MGFLKNFVLSPAGIDEYKVMFKGGYVYIYRGDYNISGGVFRGNKSVAKKTVGGGFGYFFNKAHAERRFNFIGLFNPGAIWNFAGSERPHYHFKALRNSRMSCRIVMEMILYYRTGAGLFYFVATN